MPRPKTVGRETPNILASFEIDAHKEYTWDTINTNSKRYLQLNWYAFSAYSSPSQGARNRPSRAGSTVGITLRTSQIVFTMGARDGGFICR